MVDKDLILRKISELEKYYRQIKEFSNVTIEEYQKEWKTQRIVERTLQIIIETCTDIASHIIADREMRPSTSYGDTFKILFENHMIDQELFATMEKLAKFRNIVVHQYEEVDAEIVVVILKKHLKDFEKFITTILSYLKT